MKNKYFPFKLVEHKDSYSIITSDFHFFDAYFGDKDVGGYTIQTLAKKLVKEHKIKSVKFDSEAGMFCAYGNDKDKLHELAIVFQNNIGKEEDFVPLEEYKANISEKEADYLLINGFVKSINEKMQIKFYENVPYPILTNKQADLIDIIQNGTDDEIIFASKKINNEARTLVKNHTHYLAHPQTLTYLMRAADKTENNKVYLELILAMVFICGRHLPDLRAEVYFKNALTNRIATVRWVGLMGLGYVFNFNIKSIPDMSQDKSEKVRNEYKSLATQSYTELISWMFVTD